MFLAEVAWWWVGGLAVTSGGVGRSLARASLARHTLLPNSSLPPSRGETKRGVGRSERAQAVAWVIGARGNRFYTLVGSPPPT